MPRPNGPLLYEVPPFSYKELRRVPQVTAMFSHSIPLCLCKTIRPYMFFPANSYSSLQAPTEVLVPEVFWEPHKLS